MIRNTRILLSTMIAAFTLVSACTTKIPYTKPLNPHEQPRRARYATLPHRLGGQEDVLITHLSQTGAKVIHEDTQLRIVMPANANFKSNSAILNPNLMGILDYVAATLLAYPYSVAGVHGYADSDGSNKLNQALSERRSHAVIAYLESQGIPGNRLFTTGHGERRARATNASHTGRLVNRRVEVTIQEGSLARYPYKYKHPNF